MTRIIRILLTTTALAAAAAATLAALLLGGYYYVAPSLPRADELKDVRFQTPLRVYSRDGRLISQFGEQRRIPVPYDRIPRVLVDAFVAAEDDRFFEHPGIDYAGILSAAISYILAEGERGGGSTITQQVAREYFLSREVSLVRKFKEWILALQIERELTKEEILELFCNTTFFGQRSYGVVAAAQTYFGKTLDQLTLSDAAIIAGIPQGPSIMNPVSNPENAGQRRAYVLRRMQDTGVISAQQHQAALLEPIEGRLHGFDIELEAPYLAEMVRLEMLRRFGQAAYTAGLTVTTTVDSRLQRAANRAVRANLIAYDERHGYRGPVARVDIDALRASADGGEPDWSAVLADYPNIVEFETGLVLGIHAQPPGSDGLREIPLESIGTGSDAPDPAVAEVYLRGSGVTLVGLDAVAWAAPHVNADIVGARPQRVGDVLTPGDVVRFRRLADGSLRLGQLPDVQGAFVALDPADGAISALVGGFDYFLSNFNSATQARRQPGSSFKPFLYSAALDNGYTTASIINDNALTIESAELETVWRPENYEGRFHGETRLREALVNSYNTSAIRVILDIGPATAARHMSRFGFDATALPRNASLALGAGGVAPIDLADGFATFPNGGFDVDHYFIDRVEDANGEVLYQASPVYVCGPYAPELPEVPAALEAAMAEAAGDTTAATDCAGQRSPAPAPERSAAALIDDVTDLYPEIRPAKRVISPQNAFLVADMMRDVVRRGSGARAYRELGRGDLGGKTGTTNDRRDTWFAGFNRDLMAVSWVGFLDNRPLGRGEQGGVTAIPAWISFMGEALEGRPERWIEQPSGIVEVRIDATSGRVARDARPGTMFEKFRVDHVPEPEPARRYTPSDPGTTSTPDEDGSRIF